MEYSYKFRIYPNQEQERIIQRTFGCCRFVYNHFLALRKERYATSKETLNFVASSRELTSLKNELTWLKEVDSAPLEEEVRNLDFAYQNFFHRVHEGVKPYGYPQFKRKRDGRNSYRTRNHAKNYTAKSHTKSHVINTIAIGESFVKLPKLGRVKCRVSKQLEGRILSATVSQNPSGKYFVAIICTDVNFDPLPSTGAVCGVDLGIKALATTSDGTEYPNRKFIKQSDAKLRRESRRLSRKQKGSKRREKQRIRKARLEEHIANQRRDYLQKTTTELIRNYDVICIENLKTKGMMKNHKLARALSDVSFFEFRRELEYKAEWYGKTVQVIDTFYPSSQLCHSCGYRNPETKKLSVREWTCPECGEHHDRDFNAAINILNEGLRLLS